MLLVQACIRKWGVVWHFSLKAELYGEKRLVGTWVLTQHVAHAGCVILLDCRCC